MGAWFTTQMMKPRLIVIGLLGLLLPAPSYAAPDDEAQWLAKFYQHPEPEKVASHIKIWHDQGSLASDSPVQPALLGFLSQVLSDNPAIVGPCLVESEKLPPAERAALLSGIWLANVPAAQEYFKTHDLKQFSEKPPPPLDSLVVNGPTELQFYWGRFSASGKADCIRPIIGALRFSDYAGASNAPKSSKETDADKLNALRDVTYQTALWSLESNCRQDPKVYAICKDFLNQHALSQKEEAFLKVVLQKAHPEDKSVQLP